MAKKVTRLLCVLLTLLLAASMLCVSAAEGDTALLDVVPTVADRVEKSGNIWTIFLDANTLETDFSLTVSNGATVQVVEPVYGTALTPKNGRYSLKEIPMGENTYKVTVTAANGIDSQDWSLIVRRPARKDVELYSIRNATYENGSYVAQTEGNRFMVSPNYSESATVALYGDEGCTQKISNFNLTLTALKTTVWVKVIAEDGESYSLHKLVINTSSLEGDPGVATLPMVGNGIISISGASKFDGEKVTVKLPDSTKLYQFMASGLNGYRIRVYTDATMKLMTAAEQVLALDSGVTRLYVQALKGEESKTFTVEIISNQFYTFKDTPAAWAKAYVEKLGTSGQAILKGDDKGNFNGGSNLTRYEMAIMMVRMTGANKDLYAKLSLPFMDAAEIPAWAADYIKAAYKMELIKGISITNEEDKVLGYEFQGGNKATRSEFLQVMMNVVTGGVESYYEKNQEAIKKVVDQKKFADIEKVPEWAVPAVYTAIEKGIIKGDGEKKINASDLITRNEVAAIFGRYLNGMQ